jgi:hypothetical protein
VKSTDDGRFSITSDFVHQLKVISYGIATHKGK